MARRAGPRQRGATGVKGATGHRGRIGPRGPAGPSATRADILAVVQDEFSELGKHLRVQLERTTQMQVQLDSIHGLLKQLIARD